MNSMENFFNWVTKPLPNEEVVMWFDAHNMIHEKVELFGDMFKSLNYLIEDTYMGDTNGDSVETKIVLSQEDKESHFDWCWGKMIDNFVKENIIITSHGEHKDYLKSFYMDTYYNQSDKKVKMSVSIFLSEIFDMSKPFSKSDLEMITEIYKMMDKNVK
jgi:hypothetical protein